MVSLAFVVVAMLEFACIILISRKGALKSITEKEIAKKNKDKKAMALKTKKNIHPSSNKAKKEKSGAKLIIPPSHVIDSVAFCVHFLSFLIYNIIYWTDDFQ